ncbi:hypothetical protein GCM10022381_13000 [Leifsonia kafniensis]|uniref:ParB-like N-terminal domain-containing protein n=1 Tax=Leifsonia kafniensis TaxID=475957 RepID=A0ABP7KCB7_9MICO
MGNSSGSIGLERATDSIIVGNRHRVDLGDIDALATSIKREGLLQPVTVTPNGVLVCGARRLAALRKLGIKKVNVWVRNGISDRLGELMAEQDDNVLHKPLSQTEAAALYRELKEVIAEDAASRQQASRFSSDQQKPRSDGAATVAAPSAGDTRQQAARMVSGRNSYTSLERINELQQMVDDPTQTDAVREQAQAALDTIDEGGSITAAQQRMHAAVSLAELEAFVADATLPRSVRDAAEVAVARVRSIEATARADDLERVATEALIRVKSGAKRKSSQPRTQLPDDQPALHTLRSFVLIWDDLDGWPGRYDPAVIGPGLTDEKWEQFLATVAATNDFAEAAGAARSGAARTAD